MFLLFVKGGWFFFFPSGAILSSSMSIVHRLEHSLWLFTTISLVLPGFSSMKHKFVGNVQNKLQCK